MRKQVLNSVIRGNIMRKKDYEKRFNELLGLEVEWSRLRKDDLKKLNEFTDEMLERIKDLEEVTGPITQDRPIIKILDLAGGWFKRSKGPVAKILRKVYKEGSESIEKNERD